MNTSPKANKGKSKGIFRGSRVLAAIAATIIGRGAAMADAPLQGAVDTTWVPSDRLPLSDWKSTVMPRLKPGVQWSESLLPQQNTEIDWMPLPDWLAGEWHTENASFISGSSGRIGESSAYESRHNDFFGCQKDRNGQIWHLLRFPTVSSTDSGQLTSYFIDCSTTGSAKNPFHISFDTDDIEVLVNKSDKQIQSIRRRHDATSWIKIGPMVSVDDEMSIEGSRSQNGTIRSQPKQVAGFKATDRLVDGFDAKESFNHFLVNNGKAYLVPIYTDKKVTK